MREIIFDTETTGLDAKTGDRMVEIGCIEMVNRVATGRTFHEYFNPDRDMPPEAEKVHGLSAAFLADKPRFAEKVEALLEFIGNDPLVAHNAQFDFGFLNHELGLCGQVCVGEDRMIDTLVLARRRHPGAKHSLDALCSRYGVDRSHRTLHGALLDAELLAQVYVELTGGRQIGLQLAVDNTGDGPARPTRFVPKTGEYRAPRAHAATAAELARHKAFIDSLDTALWTS
ncbi:DNA polymerase III subunit epsilon [Aurantiacibacter poecillastricola]|uniref:DNA polymerase III subunit epsilon n=1 Tax=Aurantiacibacter poecillastricola TaxID=3064385 RepID=UPI00273F0011|nr:DNA polymerase III subunit epsilon [Aurantiacibacter sp. 219JJ12-13]MDP5260511.1 DNA polymerase III subunit epsilon [Aurantiacibacter sp. 219JJ12-13]